MLVKWLVPVAGAALATTAVAQDYTPAPPQIQGEITMSDDADGEGRRYDDYPVELVRGQRIMITAAPAAGSRVVPHIELFAHGGPTPLSRRPAEGDARTARLGFTAPSTGVFTIRVVSGSPAAGRYTLAIRHNPAPSITRNPVTGGPRGAVIGSPAPPIPTDPVEPVGSGVGSGPLSRFIICPGHPRCPR